jgi:hypothetical protein
MSHKQSNVMVRDYNNRMLVMYRPNFCEYLLYPFARLGDGTRNISAPIFNVLATILMAAGAPVIIAGTKEFDASISLSTSVSVKYSLCLYAAFGNRRGSVRFTSIGVASLVSTFSRVHALHAQLVFVISDYYEQSLLPDPRVQDARPSNRGPAH